MISIAKKAGLDYVHHSGGNPPRACLAYSFIQQLFILYNYNLIDDGFALGIDEAIHLLDKEEKRIMKQAKSIAKKLNKENQLLYYTSSNMEAIALRWRQQLNENSKCAMLASRNTGDEPQMNRLDGELRANMPLSC
jgi:glucose/mannose-6-phosphate isomerase